MPPKAVERSGLPELTELPGGQAQVTGEFDGSGLTKAAYAAAGSEISRDGPDPLRCRATHPGGPAGDPERSGVLRLRSEQGHARRDRDLRDRDDQRSSPGAVVRIERIWRRNFLGATRPAGSRGA